MTILDLIIGIALLTGSFLFAYVSSVILYERKTGKPYKMFWESKTAQFVSFLKNIGLAGGFLFIVANGTKDWSVDREKKYVRL